MQAETQAHIETIKTAIDLLRKHIDFDAARARLVELDDLGLAVASVDSNAATRVDH